MGWEKIFNFMLISKMAICLSDKSSPKKLKLKNCFWRSRFGKSHLFIYFILTFLRAFCHQGTYIYIFQHIILNFFYIPNMTFQDKKISFEKSHFSNFFDTNLRIKKKLPKININTFSKIVSEIFLQSRNTWHLVNFKNHCTLTHDPLTLLTQLPLLPSTNYHYFIHKVLLFM